MAKDTFKISQRRTREADAHVADKIEPLARDQQLTVLSARVSDVAESYFGEEGIAEDHAVLEFMKGRKSILTALVNDEITVEDLLLRLSGSIMACCDYEKLMEKKREEQRRKQSESRDEERGSR